MQLDDGPSPDCVDDDVEVARLVGSMGVDTCSEAMNMGSDFCADDSMLVSALSAQGIEFNVGDFAKTCPRTCGDCGSSEPRTLFNSVRYDFEPAPRVDGRASWIGDVGTEETCRQCFDELTVSDQLTQDVFVKGVITDTSEIAKGCNCMGLFPVPSKICFTEFDDLDEYNPFKCLTNDMFFSSIVKYLYLGGNEAHWKDYVFAARDQNGKFSHVAMTEITVQTDFNVFETDAWKGMAMVNAWEEWADAYNAKVEGIVGMSKVMV